MNQKTRAKRWMIQEALKVRQYLSGDARRVMNSILGDWQDRKPISDGSYDLLSELIKLGRELKRVQDGAEKQ